MKDNRRLLVAAVLLLSTIAGCKSSDVTGTNFTVAPATYSLLVGGSVQLTATGAPGQVTWSSSNSSVATVVPQTGFVTGVGRGTATISAVVGSHIATADITVTVPPTIGLSTPTVEFEIQQGDPDPSAQTVSVTNSGDGTLSGLAVGSITYGLGEPTGWLTATLSSATAPATLTLQAHAGSLPAGAYTAIVPITSSNGSNSPQNVAVTFRIQTPPSIVLSRDTVRVSAIPNSTVDETVDITDGGTLPLTGLSTSVSLLTGQQANWLTADLSSTAAPATLMVHANTAGLPVGTYYGVIAIASSILGVSTQHVQVILTATPGPSIKLDHAIVNFGATSGTNPAPQTVAISNGGGGTLTDLAVGSIQYAGGASGWLSAAFSSTTAPSDLTLTVTSNALANGDYTATVPITSPVASNSPDNLTVKLTVGPPPMIAVNPNLVFLTGWRGGGLSAIQAVQVTNSGGGTLTDLSFSVSYPAGQPTDWLQGVWQGGGTTAPATLLLQADPGTMDAGTYTAYLEISASQPDVAPDTVTVRLALQSFETNVLPLFSAMDGAFPKTPCTNCHYAGGQSPQLGGDAATVYAAIHDKTSVLTCKITGTGSCGGDPMLMPGSWVGIIQSWIAAGAPGPPY